MNSPTYAYAWRQPLGEGANCRHQTGACGAGLYCGEQLRCRRLPWAQPPSAPPQLHWRGDNPYYFRNVAQRFAFGL